MSLQYSITQRSTARHLDQLVVYTLAVGVQQRPGVYVTEIGIVRVDDVIQGFGRI